MEGNLFQAGFYLAIKDSLSSFPSLDAPYRFFLRSFFSIVHPLVCQSYVRSISVSLCRTHGCPLLSALSGFISPCLINWRDLANDKHCICTCQLFCAFKAEQRVGLLRFSAVKHPGVCRLALCETTWCQGCWGMRWNKCVCRWKKEKNKTISRNNACWLKSYAANLWNDVCCDKGVSFCIWTKHILEQKALDAFCKETIF